MRQLRQLRQRQWDMFHHVSKQKVGNIFRMTFESNMRCVIRYSCLIGCTKKYQDVNSSKDIKEIKINY